MTWLAQARSVSADLNTTSSGHALMKYLGPICESKAREARTDEARAHGHPSAEAEAV